MSGKRLTRRDFVRGGAAVGLAASVGSAAAAKQDDKEGMPCGTLGKLKISRLILGSNVPGAHSRDLIYVSALGRAYNTKERKLETYRLAESLGINTVLQGSPALIKEYNTKHGGKLRAIRPIKLKASHTREQIKRFLGSLANELTAAGYVMGDSGDYLARDKRIDVVGTALEVARQEGVLLGVGGHALQVVLECEANGIRPDFYVKTFHHDNYWSATPRENREPFCWYNKEGGNSYSGKTGDHNRFHDNIWCLDAEKTTEVMRKVEAPWIAFKVLAAGAIHPKDGFDYAFRNGADFIAVGMCDFQLRENVAVVKRCVQKGKRDRPWRA